MCCVRAQVRGTKEQTEQWIVNEVESLLHMPPGTLSVRAHGYRAFSRRLGDFDAERLPLPPQTLEYDRGDESALELWRLGERR